MEEKKLNHKNAVLVEIFQKNALTTQDERLEESLSLLTQIVKKGHKGYELTGELLKNPPVLLQAMPHIEFKEFGSYASVLWESRNISGIEKTYKESLLTNQELLKEYDHNIYCIYRLMKEKCPQKDIQDIQKIFMDFERKESKKEINSLFYQIDLLPFYNLMGLEDVFTSKHIVKSFFETLTSSYETYKVLQCGGFITLGMDEGYMQIGFTRYKDKQVLDKFVDSLPNIFAIILPYAQPEERFPFYAKKEKMKLKI